MKICKRRATLITGATFIPESRVSTGNSANTDMSVRGFTTLACETHETNKQLQICYRQKKKCKKCNVIYRPARPAARVDHKQA